MHFFKTLIGRTKYENETINIGNDGGDAIGLFLLVFPYLQQHCGG